MDASASEWQQKMAGYILGDLSDEERREFERWLAAHPEAKPELARLEEALALLPYGLEEEREPPKQLRERVMAAAAQSSPGFSRWSRSTWVPLAAAAALVAALGFENLRLRNELAESKVTLSHYQDVVSMLHEDSTRLVTLKGMDANPAASGNIVITPGLPEVAVTLRNLPEPPQGEVYKLWAVVDGRKIACGDFMPNAGGGVYTKLPLTTSLLSAPLIVTRERESATAPSGPMIMTSRA